MNGDFPTGDQLFNEELEQFYNTGFESEDARDGEWRRIHAELRMRAEVREAARLAAIREMREWAEENAMIGESGKEVFWLEDILAKLDEMERG